MTEVEIEGLNREHLTEFQYIDAVAGYGDKAAITRVWDSRRLAPFIDGSRAAPEQKTLYVRVASLDDADIKPIIDKIDRLRAGA